MNTTRYHEEKSYEPDYADRLVEWLAEVIGLYPTLFLCVLSGALAVLAVVYGVTWIREDIVRLLHSSGL